MQIRSILMLCCGVLWLAGCNSSDKAETAEETKSVSWYQANSEALKSKLEECTNNPGELGDTANCKNAQQAATLNMSGSSKVDYSKTFKK